MAKIKKYQMGGAQKMKNAIDTSLLRKYNPKDDSVLNKSIPGRTPKQFEPKGPAKEYYKLRDDYAEPGAKKREAEMIKSLKKKPAMPASKKNVGKKGIKIKAKGGKEMIKRADGSYSQRGLWDNIRANRGSGKKPTAQMLKQEKKIKSQSKKKK